MPGTPKPVVDPRFGPLYTPIIQAQQANKQQAAALVGGAQITNLTDLYGNQTMIIGPLTGQIITIGAAYLQPGVQIQTPVFNFAVNDPRVHPTAGIMAVNVTTYGTINLTAGSSSATCVVASPSSLVNWGPPALSIGAADVSDPSTGTATPALAYGTTVSSGSGTYPNYTLTLSQNAVESGSGLYFAACTFDTFT